MTHMIRLASATALAGALLLSATNLGNAQTAAPAEAPKAGAAKAEPAAKTDAKTDDTTKKPSKAELGEMLKKCSDEADDKGLTVQKGKAEARKAYRRACMLKNGVAPRKK